MTLTFGSIRMAVLLTAMAPAMAGAQSLTKSLNERLTAPPFNRHHWGVAVLDERGKLLFGHNAERLFTPASNTKLLVTAAATMLLGPDTTVRTPVYLDGPIDQGTLRGNVILYGNGDATWTRRCFAVDTLAAGACLADPFAPLRPVASTLKRLGVRQVTGQVIGDGSFFDPIMHHPSWEVGDLVWGYGAPVSGLGFNENTVQATIRPGPTPGALAVVALWPELGALPIDVRLITVPDTERTEIDWTRAPDGVTAVVTGTIRVSER
ncbi:MAG: D-alanyl-D-alanine carboxypeptidase, partial [Gemmatimonadales bacterium]